MDVDFQVLFVGLFIIAGFSLSFFILFHNNRGLNDPWKAFSKTIIMMTGEYEYGELFNIETTSNLTLNSTSKLTSNLTSLLPSNLTSDVPLNLSSNSTDFDRIAMYNTFPPIIGKIVFICFVTISHVVLMNLTTGLAVNDVQELMNEVEVPNDNG